MSDCLTTKVTPQRVFGVSSLLLGNISLPLSCVYYGMWVLQHPSASMTIHYGTKTKYISPFGLGFKKKKKNHKASQRTVSRFELYIWKLTHNFITNCDLKQQKPIQISALLFQHSL